MFGNEQKKKDKKVEKYKKIKLEKVTKIKSVLSPFLGELTSGISLCWSGRLLSGFGFLLSVSDFISLHFCCVLGRKIGAKCIL